MRIILITIFFISQLQSDYSNHPEAEAIIEELVNKHNFESTYVIEVLSKAKKQQKILDAISSPAEFTLTWDRYKKIFIEEKRIRNGKKFINDNLLILNKAEKEFGVPKEIITAIIGVETRYGSIQGRHKVLDSLTTLGFDYPKRAKFFKSELINFFLLTRENDIDILNVKGSYAGAMGYGQFISSSYRAYAIDFDGDGFVDLFNSLEDAIGSTANYLKRHGWKKEGNIVTRAYPNNVRKFYKPHESLTQFIPLTFNENGEELHFVGDDNFRAIARYNISDVYAMAVYYLSEEFKK